MEILKGKKENLSKFFMEQAMEEAKKATCSRSKCGSVIATIEGQIIGRGFNSMPCNVVDPCFKDSLSKDFKSDKTCCLHAEERAIMDALRNHNDLIVGSRLYFIRLDLDNKKMFAGEPYCTICSKLALDKGIAEFVLWHNKGITVYGTEEYNKISFQYPNYKI